MYKFIKWNVTFFYPQLKELRALLVAGATDYDEFYQTLRTLEPCLQFSVKDLRSQVVREAAITIA